jgi:large subunit ribosomal protein L24
MDETRMHTALKCEVKTRLKKGDEVKVIAGKDKGKTGKILRVVRKSDRVIVDGVNVMKRHTKPSLNNQDGGIVDKTVGIHISNVMLIDPKSKKPTRVGFKTEGGKKVRFAKDSGTIIA